MDWIDQGMTTLRQGISFMERGLVGTGEWNADGESRDTTAETVQLYRLHLAELEALAELANGLPH